VVSGPRLRRRRRRFHLSHQHKAQGYPATLYYYLSSFLPIMSAKDVPQGQAVGSHERHRAVQYVEQKGDTTVLAANADFFLGAPKIPGWNITRRDTTTRTLRS